jgi:hypothetical protein
LPETDEGKIEESQQPPPQTPATVWPVPYPGESTAHFAKRIHREYQDMPEAYHLNVIGWQIVGHFTFKALQLPERTRWCMFTATMRTLCNLHTFYYPKLMWAVRSGLGTRKDLCPHFHFLLAALPGHIDLKRFCRDCKVAWHKFGGGIAVVEPFNRQLDGAGYLAKRPETDDCGLMFSDSVRDYLRRVV